MKFLNGVSAIMLLSVLTGCGTIEKLSPFNDGTGPKTEAEKRRAEQEKERKKTESLQKEAIAVTQAYIAEHKDGTAGDLFRNLPQLQQIRANYVNIIKESQTLLPALDLLLARSLRKSGDAEAVLAAWEAALFHINETAPDDEKVDLLLEAAESIGENGDAVAGQTYIDRVKAILAKDEPNEELLDAKVEYLKLGIRGYTTDWREIEDAIKIVEAKFTRYPFWSEMRFASMVLEAEFRIRYQPVSLDKRKALGKLKAELDLALAAQRDEMDPDLRNRYRLVMRQMRDQYQL